MEEINPYASPQLESSVLSQEPEKLEASNGALFEYHYSTRGLEALIFCLFIFVVSAWCVRIAYMFLTHPTAPTWVKVLMGAMIAYLVFANAFFDSLWIFPRVFKFCVDREFVSWSISRPACHVRIPTAQIRQIKTIPSGILITTLDGADHQPDSRTYGAKTDRVVNAIDALIGRRQV